MDMSKMGHFLQALRKERGLTQEQLGEKLHVAGKTISRWETGAYMPPVEMLAALSEMYGVTINELVNGERIAPADVPAKADEALTIALKEVPFMMHERQLFWKKKWVKDHLALLIAYLLAMAAIQVYAVVIDNSKLNVAGALLTVCIQLVLNNAQAAYVEHHLYDE